MLDTKYLTQSLEKFAKAVVKQSRSNLTKGGHKATGALYKSLDNWKVEVSPRGSVLLKFNMEDYGDFQDKGVKGSNPTKSHKMKEYTPYSYKSKMPPLKDLRKWVGNRGFQFRDAGGRFMSYDSTAFLIQRSIFQKGIPQTLFFTKPFRRQFKNLPQDIIEAFAADVDDWLSFVGKK